MLSINDSPLPLDSSSMAKFAQLSPATVGHLTSEGFVRGLSPLFTPIAFSGTAVTLRLPGLDSSLMHYIADRVGPGHVLVVDRAGEADHACLGGMVGYRLKLAGVAGVVIDGPVTDTDELKAYGIPVLHRGISSTTTRIFSPEGETNTAISVGGCDVRPGDIVIADSDGVFVGSLDWVHEHIEDLLAKQEFEGPAKKLMDEGGAIAELSGALALIEAARVTA